MSINTPRLPQRGKCQIFILSKTLKTLILFGPWRGMGVYSQIYLKENIQYNIRVQYIWYPFQGESEYRKRERHHLKYCDHEY